MRPVLGVGDFVGLGKTLPGQFTVLVNNVPINRMTDLVTPHAPPPHGPVPIPLIEGNFTVLACNLPVSGMGHKAVCQCPGISMRNVVLGS